MTRSTGASATSGATYTASISDATMPRDRSAQTPPDHVNRLYHAGFRPIPIPRLCALGTAGFVEAGGRASHREAAGLVA